MNKYKVLEPNPIDEGATYRTLLAKSLKKDEKVAIKILKKNFYSLEECKRNKEVQILQTLNHKNVQKMLELINDSNELLIVFEYMPENVKRVMKKRDKPYSETETKVIMQQVFQGLSYIHKTGLVHRNLRPDILLCDKDVSTVKISDFSMTKSVMDSLGEYDVNPVWYMSPEVLLGASNYTVLIDVWAAGCIMAELLTGKPLLPGTSDRDQMKLICELIGTFTKRDWPDGAMLRHSIGYSLPISTTGKGLTESGVNASGEAKGLIMDLLTWAPDKRASADVALRHGFFNSDGEFVNKDQSQEILDNTRLRLKEWRDKWEADLNRGSIKEFEGILADFNKGNRARDSQGNRHTFAGFEKSSPLMGDSSPRGKWSQPQTNGYQTTRATDDLLRMDRTQMASEPSRSYPLDLKPLEQSPEKNPDKNPFEEELQSREERRSRQSVPNVEPLVSAGGGQLSPRRNNPSPRRHNNNNNLGLFGGPDTNQNEIEQNEKKLKAERMKEKNFLKYREKYGFDSMKRVLGAQSPMPGDRSNEPMSSRKMQNPDTGRSDVQKETVRSREPNKPEAMTPRMRPMSRKTSFEKFAAIDHTARSERLKQLNPTKQKDRYGDPFMSELLGRKPEPKPPVQNNQPNQNGGHDAGNNGHYTPSWAQNGQVRA